MIKGTLFGRRNVKQCIKTSITNSTAICCKTICQKASPQEQGLRLFCKEGKKAATIRQKASPQEQGLRHTLLAMTNERGPSESISTRTRIKTSTFFVRWSSSELVRKHLHKNKD